MVLRIMKNGEEITDLATKADLSAALAERDARLARIFRDIGLSGFLSGENVTHDCDVMHILEQIADRLSPPQEAPAEGVVSGGSLGTFDPGLRPASGGAPDPADAEVTQADREALAADLDIDEQGWTANQIRKSESGGRC